MSVDPVSGNKVDKAEAVIGADADGRVYYFENAKNLKSYKPGK
jgi:YHS domain-containing protein